MSSIKTDASDMQNWYVSNFKAFETSLNGSSELPFHQVRKSALEAFNKLGFPGRRDEEWKYTSVSPILKHKFQLDLPSNKLSAKDIEKYAFKALSKNLVVLINGHYSPEFSNYEAPDGVIVESLSGATEKHARLVNKYLAKIADFSEDPFTALNTAFANDGVFIHIADNAVIEQPIHLLYISDAREKEFYANPRNLVIAGKHSQAKIVEKYAAIDAENVYFNNGVTEVVMNVGAKLDYIRVQDEALNAFHIKTLQAHQVRDSNFTLVNLDMGGKLVRNNFNLKLDDEHCEGHLIGAYMATGRQHIDNHTAIDHAKPNCYSNEVYKGILGGKSRGVFNGKIFVRQDAQKTNAYQNNKALLLTDDAVINSKPQLEIFADDVKCSHGATVGQLDDESLFYLRSRGIPGDVAYSMLQYAFVLEALDYVTIDEIREELDEQLLEHFRKL